MTVKIIVLNKGFTLVEVIVVLAIVGILTGASIMGITLLQKSSRDSQRLKTLEEVKAEITRIQTQTGRVPKETDIVWGETEITISGTGAESRTVKVLGLTKPKSSEICSPAEESDGNGMVYCYKVLKDGYILGADKENGIIDIGTSVEKYADMRVER